LNHYNNNLASLLGMNREEREDYVIQLYKEGITVKDIARIVHMSFRDIGTITKKVKLQADQERGYATEDTQSKSPESRAFKLFSEGKSPVEVAIALDQPGDRVRAIYREYWELTNRYKLAQVYEEARYNISDLLKLHKVVKDLGIEENDVIKCCVSRHS
jgi:transposase